MKILLLHNYYSQQGGEDTAFEAEKNLLLQKGHKVEIITFQNKNLLGFTDKVRSSFTSIYNTHSARLLAQKIDTFQPDILHAHNFWKEASPAIYFVAQQKKLPVIQTLHNFRLLCVNALLLRHNQPCQLCIKKNFPLPAVRYACYENRLISTQMALLITIHKLLKTWKKRIHHYIALTEFAKRKFLDSSLHLTESQVSVKPNFVADKGYTFAEGRENFFLFVGRLSHEKGIQIALEATQWHNFRLEIIGTGSLESLVRTYAQQNSNIIFHGKQSSDFVIKKMQKAKALLFPSICYENLPITLLEAFSTATPIIISNIENLNELVTNNFNGLHFQTGNSKDLAEKIYFFEKNLTPQWYQNARQTYLQNYTPDLSYQKLMTIYQQVLNTFSHLPK